jgi:hypothetical protein
MNTEEPARWLPTSQAAAALNVTPKTIRRRIERGELEARKVARDGGGIVWQVCIGDETLVVTDTGTDTGTDTEHPSKGTRNAHRKGQAERVTDTGTPIEVDTEKDMGVERKGHGKDTDLTTHLLEEVRFLRAALEQRDRDAAELRAALRAALKLTGATSAPQLEAGTPEAPEREQSAPVGNVPSAQPDDGHRPEKRTGAAITYDSIADEIERRLNP